jgi:hypothetical protein
VSPEEISQLRTRSCWSMLMLMFDVIVLSACGGDSVETPLDRVTA